MGLIYAFGGFDGTSSTNILEVYDPLTDTWSSGSLADDNFNDNVLDSTRWSPYVNPPGIGTVTQQNGRLEVTLNPGAANVGVNGKCFVAGDFDVQVDFLLLNWPANNWEPGAVRSQSAASASTSARQSDDRRPRQPHSHQTP
jgi:hypothetical protein